MELKTIGEWGDEFGFAIIDPDGFNRTDKLLYQRLMSREDFLTGAFNSTVSNVSKVVVDDPINCLTKIETKNMPLKETP